MNKNNLYQTTIEGGSHWSMVVRRGITVTLTDIQGGANVGMLFYNPYLLSEKYNAPDTLKCQHTFKLSKGNCLYSDMGRIFCSIVDDDFGWHETICGNSHAEHIKKRWPARDYQIQSNAWHQNGYDSFLVELAKYELDRTAMAANINWFSAVASDENGGLFLKRQAEADMSVTLRFEMDTLVVFHTCPHPLNDQVEYPQKSVALALSESQAISEDDACVNHCAENQRGFANNRLYHLGQPGGC